MVLAHLRILVDEAGKRKYHIQLLSYPYRLSTQVPPVLAIILQQLILLCVDRSYSGPQTQQWSASASLLFP